MLTAGATWYIDQEKTWAVSALNRYEFNTEQRDTHVTPGQAYTLEWGVSKTVMKVVDLGAVGYYQQQVTTNSGALRPAAATAWRRLAPKSTWFSRNRCCSSRFATITSSWRKIARKATRSRSR